MGITGRLPDRARRFQRGLRRGTWRPAALLAFDYQWLYLVLIVQPAIRGIDYLNATDPGGILPYTYVDIAVPAWVTAFAYLFGAAALTYGVLRGCHRVVWAAHWWLATCYTILLVGLVTWVIVAGDGDGMAYAATYLTVITLHVMLAIRTGPNPLPRGYTRGEAVTHAPG